jgi:hypothetical protein
VCTYTTVAVDIQGSAKGAGGDWQRLSSATVYFDHPVHAMADHTLNIDLATPAAGPAARVGIELTASSARALVEAIEAALAAVPAGLAR